MNRNSKILDMLVSDILDEAGCSVASMSAGIEAAQLCDYFMQSVFLKMVGFLEQKTKALSWELASVYPRYRYEHFFKEKGANGSTLEDKNKVYGDLVRRINDEGLSKVLAEEQDKLDIKGLIKNHIDNFRKRTEHLGWLEREFLYFNETFMSRDAICFAPKSVTFLFGHCENCSLKKKKTGRPPCGCKCTNCTVSAPKTTSGSRCTYKNLSSVYKAAVYDFRNRCAHNTLVNLTSSREIDEYSEDKTEEENYLIRLALIDVIDITMTRAYQVWVKKVAGEQ